MKSEKIASYYAVRPILFRALIEMSLSQGIFKGTGEMEQNLEITLGKGTDLSRKETLVMVFQGVRSLKFNQSDMSLITFSHIEITLDPLGFRAKNEEDDLALVCRDFSFRLVQPE